MVTPTPQSFGQLLREEKPELHLIHYVIVVHIDDTLYNSLGELAKVMVFCPRAIIN